MLTALDALIPTAIAPNSAPQTLLAGAQNLFPQMISSSTTTPVSASYRFVLNNAAPNESITFDTGGTDNGQPDVAIALYDSSGNRLMLQDTGGLLEILTTQLQSGQQYTVSFYAIETGGFFGFGETDFISPNIVPGPQATADTVNFNPATGSGALTTSNAPDAFTSATQVRYFPMNLLDVGQSATVTLSQTNPDTSVAAALYSIASNGIWTEVSSTTLAAGTASATLSVTPPSGADITDGTYQLVIAPLNFTSAFEPVTIGVTATPLLPVTINPANAQLSIPEPLSSPGNLIGANFSTFNTHAGTIADIIAPVSGPMTVSFTPATSYEPLLGIYGPGGTTLLDVTSSKVAETVLTATFNAVAGSTYYFSIGPDDSSTGGAFGFQASQSYTPTAIALSSTLGTQSLPALGNSTGVVAFQLIPPVGSNYVALQLSPTASTLQTQVQITSPNLSPQTYLASGAGQPVTVVLDQSQSLAPYDVLVSGVGGTGTGATFKYVALTTPTSIAVNQFPTSYMNLASGGLATASLATTTGTPVGIQYYQPVTNAPLTLSTYTANSSGGATAVLLHYVQNGSVLQLAEAAAPGTSGIASVNDLAEGHTLHALVALPVNFSGTGTVQLSVFGPMPKGTALAEVPNALPGQNMSNYQSTVSVTQAVLTSSTELDLYSVQLPFDMTSTSSTLQFTPASVGGTLNATVSVLNSSNGVLGTATNTAGQPVSIPVSGLTTGETLRFAVQPVAGSNVGGGGYSLSMTVNTTNPLPYLVTESAFYTYVPPSSQIVGDAYLPNVAPTLINYGVIGGSASGNFTSSVPYNYNGTGSIQVFEITDFPYPGETPFQVYTTDNTPNVDTDIALYEPATYNSGGGTVSYAPVAGTSPSFDYYPGDRSQVDAKIVVNNMDLDPTQDGGEFNDSAIIYAVVMNEQGTQGSYTITVAPVTTTTTGPGVTSSTPVIPEGVSGDTPYLAPAVETVNGTTFDSHIPSDATGTANLVVKTTDGSTGETIRILVAKFGQIIVPNPITGTVGTGGIVNISFGEIPGDSYTIGVVTSTMPEFGLDLWVAFTEKSPTGPSPAATTTSNVPLDAGYNSALSRIDPGPDGTVSQSYSLSGGAFSTIFTVENAGPVSLNVAYPAGATNVDVALYQSGQQGSGSNNAGPYTSNGVLLDYSNTANGSGNYTFNEYLEPGTYFLVGNGTASGTATVTGTIPAVLATVVGVEPSTGETFASEDTVMNNNVVAGSNEDFPFVSARYSTFFFETTIPANASGQPISVEVYDVDNNTDTTTSTGTGGVGTVSLTLWRYSNGVYTNVGTQTNALNDHNQTDFPVVETDTPTPGTEYFIGVDLNAYTTAAFLAVTVPIVTTGRPDYSVSPLQLLPDYGQTLAQTTVSNASFTSAPPTEYTIQLGSLIATREVPALAPFGTFLISAPWTPVLTTDSAQVIVNPGDLVPELSLANDATALVSVGSVGATIPAVTIALADTAMTGEGTATASTGGGTWGRYIAGVSGQTTTINLVASDADADLFEVMAVGPFAGSTRIFNSRTILPLGESSDGVSIPINFGSLLGTSTTNLNQIQFFAVDAYGLRTPTYIQTLDVAQPPTFLTGGIPTPGNTGAGGTITFNASNHTFTYNFQDSIISLSDTLSQLLDFSVPVIGSYNNEFLVDISGTGTGGLNPANDIPLALTGQAELIALNDTLFNKSYSNYNASSNVRFTAAMTLAGNSLVPGSVSVNMTLTTLPIENYTSPLIPIVSFGVPGIASVDAGIKFGIASNISGGVTLGLDPTGVSGVEGYLGAIGVMSPTFIQPSIVGTASVVGQVSVLGYDVADLSGSVTLTLTLTLGLDNSNPDAVIPFSQAVNDLAVTIDADLKIGISASVLGFSVFSYNLNDNLGNIVNTVTHGIFLTDPPSMAPGDFIGPGGGPDIEPANSPTAVISTGSSLVGAYTVDPSPQIVINPSNGMALSAQVTNVGSANAPQGNLVVASRANSSSGWTTGTTLSENNDVANPVLALTNDGSAGTTPAVVVYDVDDASGSPSTQTLNQRLDSSDIAYRYFNGTSWGSEIRLTSDSLYDGEQSVAFDSSGAGVLAYVHNTDSTPIGVTSGIYDDASNDIYASVWNKTTHTWGTPVAITNADGIADAQPSTFVDSTGKMYIVWIRATSSGSQLWFSTNTGSGWSAPAQLGITGLASGGTFKNVAVGSDGSGRVNVLFSYETTNPDGSLTTNLYQRPATTAGFTNTLPAVQIGANANFSGLRVTNNLTGGLVAYWEQSDGQMNQIFESTITSGVSTTPTQVSDDPNVAMEPSAAVDTNNVLQVLYDNTIMYGGTSQGNPTDPSVGAPLAAGEASSSIQMLPQLTFSQGLSFPVEAQSAPIGTSITGTAVVANRGLAAATLTITAYDGLPGTGTVVGTPVTINLSPGANYDYSQAFTVLSGDQTYSLQLTTSSGQAFDTTENLSSTTLDGLADIASTGLSVVAGGSNPAPGQATTLSENFQNDSNASIGAFVVTLYSGDPLSPQYPLTVLGTQNVSGLAANASGSVQFNITIPAGAGDDVYSAVVNSTNSIAESNYNNNESRFELDFLADPAVYNAGTGAVVATLLNSNASNNVQVVVNVENLGAVSLFNLPIDLQDSRNGGPLTSDGQMIIPELDPNETAVETFTVTALGGDNVFVGSIDSSVFPEDSNLANDSGSADLYVPGLPTLSATVSLSSGTTPVGGALTLTANVSNSGTADATAVPYLVLASLTSGGPSYIVGSGTGNPAAQSVQSTPISLNTAGLTPGAYTLTFEIDPNQTVVQGSEAGNVVTISEFLTGGVTLTGPAEYLRLDGNGQTLDIWNSTSDTGSPNQQILLAAISSLTVAAPSGIQNLTVDFSIGDPLPSSGLTFTGPSGGQNILNIDGSIGNDTATVNASSVTFTNSTIAATINYANVIAINFAGTGGSDTLTQTAQPGGGAGLTFVNPNSSSTLNVNAGHFNFPAAPAGSGFTPITLGALNIGNGAVVSLPLPDGSANRSVLILNTIGLTGTGTLNLSSNDMIVHNTPLGTIVSDIQAGYHNGTWTGTGITSSAAAIDPAHLTALGAVSNNLGSTNQLYGLGSALGTFDGQNPLLNDVLVKFTYYGDANLNGKVDASDYSRIDNGYLNHLTGWYNGDFNYDGTINGSDYTLIDNAFNMQGAVLADAISSIPPAAQIASGPRLVAMTPQQNAPGKLKPARARVTPDLVDQSFVAASVRTATPLFSNQSILFDSGLDTPLGSDASAADELLQDVLKTAREPSSI